MTRDISDEDRLNALYRYRILDSPREEDFDQIVQLVCEVYKVPIAAINLVDRDRQWFKAEAGLGCDETDLECSICVHAIDSGDELFVVEDTTKNPITANNRNVTGPVGIRFYAGATLRTPEGHALGTLLIVDTSPRKFSKMQAKLLHTLARQVVSMMETRRISEFRKDKGIGLQSDLDLNKDVLSIVSHDLRSPMSAITLAAHMTSEIAKGMKDGAKLVNLSSILKTSVQDMSRLISDLTEYSAIDEGQLLMKFRKTGLSEIALSLDTRFRVLAERAGVRFSIEVDDGLPAALIIDPYRLLQAVGNLVTNALQFTPKKGKLALHLRAQDSFLGIDVTNSGGGVTAAAIEDMLKGIWTTDAGSKGLGIGLSIARSIARGHGGDVTATSVEGESMTFSLTVAMNLPASRMLG